jgi:hypothetical protein
MELAFQIVPTVNRVWRDVHIPGEGRFSKRVGKEPQLEVVLGPSFPALDREPSYMLNSRLLLLTGKENKLRHLIPLWKLMNSVDPIRVGYAFLAVGLRWTRQRTQLRGRELREVEVRTRLEPSRGME